MIPPASSAPGLRRRRACLLTGLVLPVLLAAQAPGHASDGAERADVLIAAATTNMMLAKLLPQPIEIAGDRAADGGPPPPPVTVWLVEARYCGAGDGGRGRVLGVVRSRRDALPATPPLLDAPGDCRASLEKMARRTAFASLPDAALVELAAAFAPWQVRVSVGSFVTAPAGSAGLAAALTRAQAAPTVRTIRTGAQSLSLPDFPAQTFDVAVRFGKADGVTLTLTPTPMTGASASAAAAPGDPLTLPEGADATFRVSDGLANHLLDQATQNGPLVVPVDRQAIELRRLHVASQDDRASLRARATPRGLPESVGLAVDAAGGDLRLVEVRAQPELEDCAGLSMMSALGCRARNAARSTAAATLAGELTARTRGQTVRTLGSVPSASITVGAQRLRVRVTPTRLRATAAGLTATGTIAVTTDD
ncbi:MAG TPA: hypothetical protein VNO55_06535 [Polyangia bacterium]|nr:hypothetical protein [Polyangia bacterium]